MQGGNNNNNISSQASLKKDLNKRTDTNIKRGRSPDNKNKNLKIGKY